MSKKLLTYLLILLLFSCEENILIDYPEAQTNLVLNANLIPGDTLNARLGLSVPYTNRTPPPYIKDGDIEVFEDGVFIGNMSVCKSESRSFQSTDSIYTYCLAAVCDPHKNYKLIASHKDYPSTNGETKSTSLPNISNVTFGIGPVNDFINVPISFIINDDPSVKNYYFFEVLNFDSITGSFFDFDFSLSTLDLTIEMLGESEDILEIPTGESSGKKGFLSDHLFNGQQKKVNITLQFTQGFTNYLKVTSCSESFYQYSRLDILSLIVPGENPFSEPYQTYSNVSNGYGVVGSSKDTVIVLKN